MRPSIHWVDGPEHCVGESREIGIDWSMREGVGSGPKKCLGWDMRRSGVILLIVMLALAGCRGAGLGRASGGPIPSDLTSTRPERATPVVMPSIIPVPSLSYVWPPTFLAITPVREGQPADEPSSCGDLETVFLQDWCAMLMLPRELARMPAPDALGQNVETFAYLIRRVIEQPDTACTDPLILHWYEIAPLGNGGRTPTEACDAFIAKVLDEGQTRVSDPVSGTTVLVPIR